jgi:pimeloyl-ACP methyl ester carboxylesterase
MLLEHNGADLYLETAGSPQHPAVLLLHAGVATLRMWDTAVPWLARDHFVIRYDARGFGRTTSDTTPFANHEDAVAVLDHLSVDAATIVGASRGGAIAINLAVATPGRVQGLVTIGSGPGGFPATELTPREESMLEEAEWLEQRGRWEEENRLSVRLWTFGPERDETHLDPEFVRLAYELNAANLPTVGAELYPISLDPPAYGRVADIAVPTLILTGSHDLSETEAQAAYLAANIPGAERHVFADAAHLPSVECPDEFERVLGEWLRRHEL